MQNKKMVLKEDRIDSKNERRKKKGYKKVKNQSSFLLQKEKMCVLCVYDSVAKPVMLVMEEKVPNKILDL